MEKWEKEFRERAEGAVQEGSYRLPYDRFVDKKEYIDYQVEKERKHRRLTQSDIDKDYE